MQTRYDSCSRDLEDEDIVASTLENDVRRHCHPGGEAVDARTERLTTELAASDVGEVGGSARSDVVRIACITDRGSELTGGGRSVVGGSHLAGDLSGSS